MPQIFRHQYTPSHNKEMSSAWQAKGIYSLGKFQKSLYKDISSVKQLPQSLTQEAISLHIKDC